MRMYNPTETEQSFTFGLGKNAEKIMLCRMDEKVIGDADIKNSIAPKKIATYKIEF